MSSTLQSNYLLYKISENMTEVQFLYRIRQKPHEIKVPAFS